MHQTVPAIAERRGCLAAQGKSHGHVSPGAGAIDLNGGLDWVIAGGPIGIGAQVGAGWVFFAAIEMAGWWAKTVQLDLEAKGMMHRNVGAKPLRWHRGS